MNGFKKIDVFVSKQLEDFFDDLEDSRKNIKLFTTFPRISTQYENTEMQVSLPEKKFQSKVRVMNNKKTNKGIF